MGNIIGSNLLADFGAEEIAAFMFGGMFLLIPIVAIFTHHQRKMAEILNRARPGADPAVLEEVLRLRDEVQRLRADLHETTIALDDLRGTRTGQPGPPRLEQRIGEKQ